MTVLEDWHHFARDYATRGTPDGINVAFCGLAFAPFQPNPTMAQGEVIIPLGSPELANSAVQLMSGEIECEDFLAERAAAPAGAPLPVVAPVADPRAGAPLELGVPGDIVLAQPSAFTIVDTDGENLVLFAHQEFLPVVMEYAAVAPSEGISISICGQVFAPFRPLENLGSGMMVIPLGDAETARRAADVMAGIATCDTFAVAGDDITIEDLLPTPSATLAPISGLTISSPSDTYEAMTEEIIEARVAVSPFTGGHVINLTFGPGLALWFGAETGEHLGERIALSVCGEVITDPTVQEAITGVELQISGSFQKAEAENIAARIRGDIPCGG
ncbi:hypothetical protein KUL25_15355 [Rhodobacteraceae bacterium N5(2021)]|uniref:SecDF P1 head subdomain domain-containing protein n=1 Tax=Gymnodinialimonas phycosphaerae TaxID=2841589 RepID=A0A975TT62_9RHOB|nr:hypothetical protein [Gymnodinialimonas phycosphaerae]MBY4894133.1 hypothetical protein [Gymnodinialimonas phycosphaerae]